VIDQAHAQSAATDRRRVGDALMARLTGRVTEPVSVSGVQGWVDTLTSRLPAHQACAVAEHLFGVLPLVETFFESDDARLASVRSGEALGALGLFTPTPAGDWGATIAGKFVGDGLLAWGEVRLASAAADGSIVAVRVGEGDQRLAWVDHRMTGVQLRGIGEGTSPPSHAPKWIELDGVTIASAHVSRSVRLEPGAELYERLERYAAAWSLLTLAYTRATIRSLRRAARNTRRQGLAEECSASQLLMMDIGELEIETELTSLASTRDVGEGVRHPSGLVAALAAARALAGVAAKAREVRDQWGLPLDGPLADDGTAALLASYIGGAWMLESELARAVGPGCAQARSTR
jgi:hypothetical protein